jgi:heme-degrading monooxygenase HmoA
MLLKIIVVQVVDTAAYDRAQRAWTKLRAAPGFIAQTGGWTHSQHAIIAAFWESRSAHTAFMKGGHDALEREYLGSHRAIDVTLAREELAMRGESPGIREAVKGGSFLRLTDCHVEREHLDHFLAVQRDVWTPAMRTSPGMLGGTFAQVEDDARRFFVASLWSDERAHDRYQRERFPAAYTASAAQAGTTRIMGQFAQIIPEWRVIRDAGA